jgi:hypothetical protein
VWGEFRVRDPRRCSTRVARSSAKAPTLCSPAATGHAGRSAPTPARLPPRRIRARAAEGVEGAGRARVCRPAARSARTAGMVAAVRTRGAARAAGVAKGRQIAADPADEVLSAARRGSALGTANASFRPAEADPAPHGT